MGSTEVEFLLYGKHSDTIDVEDWIKYTKYNGYEKEIENNQKIAQSTNPPTIQKDITETNLTIKNFWSIVKNDFTTEDQSALLKFSTSLFRPPLLGFKYLIPNFTIQPIGNEPNSLGEFRNPIMNQEEMNENQMETSQSTSNKKEDNEATASLPKAHTCFNTLRLPAITDRQLLKEKILTAIYETEGFGFG